VRFNEHRLMTRDIGEWWNITEHCPLPFDKGGNGYIGAFS